ncbi:hypothetical protein D3C71_1716100 [compost metagenome]
MAKISVTKAIMASAIIIRYFRLKRSAHTPANGDNKKVGMNPQIINNVIIIPDFVVSVTYHIIAY